MKLRNCIAAGAAGILAAGAGVLALDSSSSAAPVTSAEISVNAQSGANPAQKLDSAFTAWAAAAANQKPTILFTPNTTFDLSQRVSPNTGQPYRLQTGMRFACLDSIGREFGNACKIAFAGASNASAFSIDPTSNAQTKDVSFVGIEFSGPSTLNFMAPTTDFSSGPILSYSDFRDTGFNGFKTVMHARHLGVRMENIYTNNSSDTPYKIAGSDNTYSSWFLDSPNLAVDEYQFYAVHLSKTDLIDFYVTCDNTTCLRQDGGQGLRISGGDWEGRNATSLAAGAPILANGGNLTISGAWIAYGGGNVAGLSPRVDKGLVQVNTGASVTISDVEFGKSGTPSTFFHVYAAGGKVCYGTNRVEDGTSPTFKQSVSGLIGTCAPTVTVG